MTSKTWSLLMIAVVLGGAIYTRAGAAEDTSPPVTKPASDPSHVFEMRKYYAMPGKLDALQARFRNHTTKLFEKHGMTNIGYWTPAEGPEAGKVLIYLLAFPSREAKDAAWKGFRTDPEWKRVREESEKDGKIVEKVESTILSPTDYSAIR